MTAPDVVRFADLLDAYRVDPGPETLIPLRRAIRASGSYRADLTPGSTLGPLLREGAYHQAVSAARAMMPGALLSPSAHLVLAQSHEQLGDPVAAEREDSLARLALRSILATGDGSQARPWSVLRLSDEYDVLRHLGTTSSTQQLVTLGGRQVDRHRCADSSTWHFDVTGLG